MFGVFDENNDLVIVNLVEEIDGVLVLILFVVILVLIFIVLGGGILFLGGEVGGIEEEELVFGSVFIDIFFGFGGNDIVFG